VSDCSVQIGRELERFGALWLFAAQFQRYGWRRVHIFRGRDGREMSFGWAYRRDRQTLAERYGKHARPSSATSG
jgi:hypothetical protein